MARDRFGTYGPSVFRLALYALLVTAIIGGVVALFVVNSNGKVTREKIKASNGDCVIVVKKSNGWDDHTIDLRSCDG